MIGERAWLRSEAREQSRGAWRRPAFVRIESRQDIEQASDRHNSHMHKGHTHKWHMHKRHMHERHTLVPCRRLEHKEDDRLAMYRNDPGQ